MCSFSLSPQVLILWAAYQAFRTPFCTRKSTQAISATLLYHPRKYPIFACVIIDSTRWYSFFCLAHVFTSSFSVASHMQKSGRNRLRDLGPPRGILPCGFHAARVLSFPLLYVIREQTSAQ